MSLGSVSRAPGEEAHGIPAKAGAVQPLTRRQTEALLFLVQFWEREDRLPTTRELAATFEVTQTAGQQYLRSLESKGYLERRTNSRSRISPFRFSRRWASRPKTNAAELLQQLDGAMSPKTGNHKQKQ